MLEKSLCDSGFSWYGAGRRETGLKESVPVTVADRISGDFSPSVERVCPPNTLHWVC